MPVAGNLHDFQEARISYDYNRTLTRLEQSFEGLLSLYQRERSEAEGLFAQLASHPPEQRDLFVQNSRHFKTWGLFELLISRSREEIFRDPLKSEELARLAIKVSGELDPLQYGAHQIQDLRSRAWGYIANSFRLRFDLRRSEEAFGVAFIHLHLGTGDPFERALLLDLKASLLNDQRRFQEALRLLRRVVLIFQELSDNQRLARALIGLGTTYYHLGKPEESIKLLSEADALIEPSEDPRLLLTLRHNRVDSLINAGRLFEAVHLFGRSKGLYRQFPNPSIENRCRWIRAKIARASRRFAEAERLFQECNEGFLAASRLYDAALVSIDLASLYEEQGRNEEAARLKGRVRPILISQNVETVLH
jgi:tetratricopeptide (TPR) repeat protein